MVQVARIAGIKVLVAEYRYSWLLMGLRFSAIVEVGRKLTACP
jgi:hypothetical protein